MKKLIYTVLGFLATSATFAQSLIEGRPGHADESGTTQSVLKQNSTTFGKATVSDWYDPADWLNKFTGGGNSLTTFVDFLMPDSLAIYVDKDDSIRRFYSIAVGQVIDPRDQVIDNTDNPGIRLSKFNSYSLDSIYINYLYVRNVDSIDDGMGGKNKVVDTLIIRYFTPSGLTFRKLTSATPQFSFAEPNWNISTLSPTGFVAEQIITLDDKDSTMVNNRDGGFENSWFSKILTKETPAGINIPAQGNSATAHNVVAYTIQFKPGMPYDTSSVLIYQKDSSTFPIFRKRVNYFGYRFASNNENATQWREVDYFNHSLFSDKENAYYPSGTINNGWDGFIPGNAFFAGRNIYSGLHMTSQNVGLKDIKNDNFAMTNVYPNPASVNGQAVTGINLKQSGNVKVSIVNLVGQEVKTVVNKHFTAGEHEIIIDLNGLNSGVYFVNTTINGFSETRKLTIGQ